MSVEIMSRVWKFSPQKGSNLLLLLALADNANDDGVCWPGLDYLHQKIRMSKRQTQRLLDKLESTGEIIKQGGGVGRGDRTYYYIVSGMEPQDKASLIAKLKKDDILSPKQEPSAKQAKVDIAMSRKVDILNVLGGHDHAQNDDNRIQPSLEPNTGEAPVAIAPAPAIDLLGLDEPVHSKPLEKAQQAKAIERLGEQPPSKETPKEPSKVPLKVPAPTSEVKDALAILCYGTKDAWALNANKGQLGKVLKEIPGLTIEQLRTFFCNWYAKDWRGKRGDKPKPREVSAEWTILTTTPCSDETAAVLGSVASPSSGPNWIPDPDRLGMFIKPSQLRTRQAEVSHAN